MCCGARGPSSMKIIWSVWPPCRNKPCVYHGRLPPVSVILFCWLYATSLLIFPLLSSLLRSLHVCPRDPRTIPLFCFFLFVVEIASFPSSLPANFEMVSFERNSHYVLHPCYPASTTSPWSDPVTREYWYSPRCALKCALRQTWDFFAWFVDFKGE